MQRLVDCFAFLRQLRVDLVLFLFNVSVYAFNVGATSLLNQKACYPDGPPTIDKICDQDNLEGHKYAVTLNTLRMTLRECLPGAILLLAGSWRDYTGLSKPLLVIAHLGELIATTVNLISSQIWSMSIWTTILIDTIVAGLSGSRVLVTMACLTYITERTSDEQRACRLSCVLVAMLGGVCIAYFLGGMLLLNLGYFYFFVLILVIYGVNVSLTLILVKDTRRMNNNGGPLESLKGLKVIFRKRPNNFVVWSCIICTCLESSILMSEGTVSVLFLNKVLGFNMQDAGFLGGYKMLITLISAAIVTPIFKKIFNLSDFTIAITCPVPSIVSCFGLAFSRTAAMVYIFATCDLMRIVLLTALWSILTRCLKKTELGVYTSLLSFGEAVLPIGLNALYSIIFQKTLDTNVPGAFYIVSGCFIFLVTVLICVSKHFYTEVPSEELKKDEDIQSVIEALDASEIDGSICKILL